MLNLFDYSNLSSVSTSLIKKFGRQVTLIKYDTTVQDNDKPWRGSVNPRINPDESLILSAVFVTPTGESSLGLKYLTEDILKRSDLIAILGSSEDLSGFNELIDSDSKRYKIVMVDSLKPAETTLLHYVALKK